MGVNSVGDDWNKKPGKSLLGGDLTTPIHPVPKRLPRSPF